VQSTMQDRYRITFAMRNFICCQSPRHSSIKDRYREACNWPRLDIRKGIVFVPWESANVRDSGALYRHPVHMTPSIHPSIIATSSPFGVNRGFRKLFRRRSGRHVAPMLQRRRQLTRLRPGLPSGSTVANDTSVVEPILACRSPRQHKPGAPFN